jgi:hypothetical protein
VALTQHERYERKDAVLRHIAAQLQIARQHARIARLRAEGQPTDVAEKLLLALADALRVKSELDALARLAK